MCGIVIDPIIRRVRGPMGLPGSTSIVTRLLPRCLKYAPHAPRQPSKEYLWPSSPAPQRKPQNVQYSFLSLQIKIIMKENPGNCCLLNGKPFKLMISFPQQLVLIFTFQIQLVISKFIIKITTSWFTYNSLSIMKQSNNLLTPGHSSFSFSIGGFVWFSGDLGDS